MEENDEVRTVFKKDPERQEKNKYISETSEAKEEMISRRRELSPLPQMSKASSQLRTENVHEIWEENRTNTENSSIFIYIVLIIYYISILIFKSHFNHDFFRGKLNLHFTCSQSPVSPI